ncbi:N-(5'-phosphoribosyl)anthranilate isomerase [Kitasatospora sp. NPDC048722]|uniref:N-(5'-phosphoribosyl)anthranilate isomerase n=1 Tax=Kitasatospora sp. NPDC048722 TaxID=3155639 RepID=UPI0033F9620B
MNAPPSVPAQPSSAAAGFGRTPPAGSSPAFGSTAPPGAARRPAPRHLKVCGARTTADVALLAAAGPTLVGLWHGVPGGPADLSAARLTRLAAAAHDRGLEPVLVTFLDDAAALADLAGRARVRWIQLHAYQSPAVVADLRRRLPGAVLVKVLHLARGRCLERPFIGAFERAGCDLFLLDTITDDGRVGSTGHPLRPADVHALLPRLTIPFLLAGGLNAGNRPAYATVTEHPLYAGADIDTAARDGAGRFTREALTALARAWHPATLPSPLPLPSAEDPRP